MTTADMIRELCEKQNISLAELCRRIGQNLQNFNKKLVLETVLSNCDNRYEKPECEQCEDCSYGSFCPHDCEKCLDYIPRH